MPPPNVTVRPMPFGKYQPYVPIQLRDRTWPDRIVDTAPLWCSVDLRDGNQALIDPMDPVRKRHMFDALVQMGFKEIEVGFPSASQPDFDFVRQLIEDDLIPDDVTIQVLMQCRQELIERTYECIAGRPAGDRALLQLDQPAAAARWCSASTRPASSTSPSTPPACAASSRSNIPRTAMRYEYSPESFTLTEPDFAIEICERGDGRGRARRRPPGDPQPAGHRRVLHAQRLRRRDRVVRPHDLPTRASRAVAAPAQRPRRAPSPPPSSA